MAHALRAPAVIEIPTRIGVVDRLVDLRPGGLVALYAAVSYAMLFALTATSLVFASNAVYEQVDLRLQSSASASADFVAQTLQARAGVVASFAERPSLVAAMAAGRLDPAGEAALTSHLVQLKAAVDGAYTTWLTWPDGRQAASSTNPELDGTDFSHRDWYTGALAYSGPYLSVAYQSAATGHPLVVAEAMRVLDDNGRLLGVLGVAFDLKRLQQFVDTFSSVQAVDLLIVDQAGTIIVRAGGGISSLVKSNDPDVTAALQGRAGIDQGLAQTLAAYSPVTWAGWALVADVSRSTALAGLVLLQRSVLLAAGLLALVNLGSVVVLNAVTTRRARVETVNRQASEYARSLLEASLDPLVTISAEGKITDVNEAAVKVTGVERTALIGTDFSDYFTEPDRARSGYTRVFADGSVTDYPLTIRARDGHLTHVLYNASVYRDMAGKVLGVFAAARDVTAQRQASQYARSLLEASLDPLVTINPEGKVTDVNEAAVKVTGLERTALVGTDFSDYFTEPEKALAGYQRVFAEGSVTDYPLTIRGRDGHLTHVLYNASIYRDMDGKVLGVFAAARDVTAQHQAEDEIRNLNRTLEQRVTERTAELEASNKELEAFTYSVSHDLRAPLRAMAGFANLLEQKHGQRLGGEAQQYVHRIDANATKMGSLIDELLRFSRVGRAGMNVGLIDPTIVARAAVDDLRQPAKEGGVQVILSPLPQCQADAGLLQQVYANLVSNAIKFSASRPGARVEVGAHQENGQTVYDVRDNGVGFDMRYAQKLFGVFQRLTSDPKYQGTGVGLALVQRIVHRHGGRVWAEAEVDKGATFHFTLGGIPI